MLEPGDRFELACGVQVRGEELRDEIRAEGWPLNGTASFVLARAGRPLRDIAGDVAAAFAVPQEQARADVLAFVWRLNRLLLANVEPERGRCRRLLSWARLAVRLLPAGTLPPAAVERHPVDTTSATRAAASVARAVWRRSAVVAGAGSAAVLQLGAVAGQVALGPVIATGLAAGASIVVHEGAHAAALRRIPAALVLDGRRTFVLHRRVDARRRALVALSGPLAVCLPGIGLAALAVAAGSETLVVAACVCCAHAAGLTLLGPDGRAACAR